LTASGSQRIPTDWSGVSASPGAGAEYSVPRPGPTEAGLEPAIRIGRERCDEIPRVLLDDAERRRDDVSVTVPTIRHVAPAFDLPANPPGREDRDLEFAEARRQVQETGDEWRLAGGFWPVGGDPNHPDEWARVVSATERRDALGRKASPPAPRRLLQDLRAHHPEAIENAITWLESDPFAYKTGYLKQKIMSGLCGAPISPEQADRLRYLLLLLTTRGPRLEFRDACRLACHLDSTEFRGRLTQLSVRPEPDISYAATRMLAACESKAKKNQTG
jgi:hypothetical protein